MNHDVFNQPAPLVERLSLELQKVLKSPEVMAKLAELGSRDVSDTPAHAAKFIAMPLYIKNASGVDPVPTNKLWSDVHVLPDESVIA